MHEMSRFVVDIAYTHLFGPLGMRHVMLDFDTTGTPIGASHMLASARDWARLGQLYLDDGVAGGHRILPVGWVANAVTPTLATGYGAGWWTNRVEGLLPGWGCHGGCLGRRRMRSSPVVTWGSSLSSFRPNRWSSCA